MHRWTLIDFNWTLLLWLERTTMMKWIMTMPNENRFPIKPHNSLVRCYHWEAAINLNIRPWAPKSMKSYRQHEKATTKMKKKNWKRAVATWNQLPIQIVSAPKCHRRSNRTEAWQNGENIPLSADPIVGIWTVFIESKTHRSWHTLMRAN